MGVKIQMVRCGRCGKPRGLTHTCIIRLDRKTKPGRTRIKPRAKVTSKCSSCGKERGPLHTCKVRTDFKRRKAAAARREAADRKRRRAAERRAAAQARQQARAAAQRQRARSAKSAKPAHDYRACPDDQCRRYACQAWKQALHEGYEQGYQDGVEACARTHTR